MWNTSSWTISIVFPETLLRLHASAMSNISPARAISINVTQSHNLILSTLGVHGITSTCTIAHVGVTHKAETERTTAVLISGELGDCCLRILWSVKLHNTGSTGATVSLILNFPPSLLDQWWWRGRQGPRCWWTTEGCEHGWWARARRRESQNQ